MITTSEDGKPLEVIPARVIIVEPNGDAHEEKIDLIKQAPGQDFVGGKSKRYYDQVKANRAAKREKRQQHKEQRKQMREKK